LSPGASLLNQHASTVFEDYCRSLRPGSKPYWEKNIKLDGVQEISSSSAKKQLWVGEMKFKRLSPAEKAGLQKNLERRWQATKLAAHWPPIHAEILDVSALLHDAALTAP